MKLKEVNECIAKAKRDIGDGLICSVIANIENGATIAKVDCDDKLGAISAQMLAFLTEVVSNTSQKMGRYFFCEVNENVIGVFINADGYVWNVTVNPQKVPIGMIINVYLDEYIEKFEAAI